MPNYTIAACQIHLHKVGVWTLLGTASYSGYSLGVGNAQFVQQPNANFSYHVC